MNVNSEVNSVSVRKKIIVVGAGMAGISAAKEICKIPSFDIKILEAAHRIGGRVLTENVGDVPVELGATFIHGTATNVIYELSKQYGLITAGTGQCDDHTNMFAGLSNGDPISSKTVVECWNKWLILANDDQGYISSQVDKYKDLYDYYAGEYPKLIEEDYLTSEVLSMPAYYDSIFECFLKFESVIEGLKDCKHARIDDDYIDLPGTRDVRFGKGYSYGNLINKLVEDLPKDAVLYGREVVSINTESDPILIKCGNGDQFEADHVIVTVPLGVLKKRCLDENLLPNKFSLFTPALPVEKQEAIRNLGFGQVGKIVLQFNEEISRQYSFESLMILWLAEDKNDPVIKQKFPWATDLFMLDRIHDSHLYESWVTGNTVIEVERATKEEIKEAFSYILSKMFRHPVPKPVDIHMHSWGSDPLFGGCYTTNLTEVNTSACILSLGKPLNNNQVLFAGEATSVEFYSTVHGAYYTGVREAKRLKDMYHV